MKNLLLFTSFLLTISYLHGQSPKDFTFALDHTALSVKDVNIITTKTIHFSLAVKPFDKFVDYLRAQKIPFYDWLGLPGKIAKRADGIQQVYVQDPDGYWIEINDVKRK